MSRRRQTTKEADTDTAAAPVSPPGEEPIAHDVVIIGAGLAGINTAYRLRTEMPHLRFAVLEARGDVGGTWDLFRYPGVRSDSDMYTFGFAWHPWRHKLLGSGAEIMDYLHEAVSAHGLGAHIRFRHRVAAADWSSAAQRWTVRVDHDGRTKTYVARWLVLSPGLLDHEEPLPTVIPGLDDFEGTVIHPQFWPKDYDYTDKRIVIVGSGATAVTLLPALVTTGAAHVTMLQRSPSYIVTIPIPDHTKPPLLARLLPAPAFGWLRRLSWNATMALVAFMCGTFPAAVRRLLAGETRRQLPARVAADPHFAPRYDPWQQRMCYAPDGDFYAALHSGRADVATGTIRRVAAAGVELDDGTELPADALVTATGFALRFAGGIPVSVDGGDAVAWPDRLLWNGCMVQDVPNLLFTWGYTNASWTVGVDETARIAVRLLRHMEARGMRVAVPRTPEGFATERQSMWKLTSTYVRATGPRLPKYGSEGPWRPRGNLLLDLLHARWGNITKGLEFKS